MRDTSMRPTPDATHELAPDPLACGLRPLLPWERRVRRLLNSSYEVVVAGEHIRERDHLWLGHNAASAAPVLLNLGVLHEHAWFLGESGTGKSHLGFAPLIAQLVRRMGLDRHAGRSGDSSVVILDMKGDYHLFQGARLEAEAAGVPFRWFTHLIDTPTFAFNPLLQSYRRRLSTEQFAWVLLKALDLFYGTGYGKGHFTYVHRDVLAPVMKQCGPVHTLRDLNRAFNQIKARLPRVRIEGLSRRDAEDARHLYGIVSDLSSVDALNVVPEEASPPVAEAAIDMADVCQKPQVLYFYLPATLAPSMASVIGRLALFSLLTSAAANVARGRGQGQLQVYLFVDEFQELIAKNLSIVLDMARSHKIAVLLANQHIGQLKAVDPSLIEALETVNFTQTFGASSREAEGAVVETSGEYLAQTYSHTGTRNDAVILQRSSATRVAVEGTGSVSRGTFEALRHSEISSTYTNTLTQTYSESVTASETRLPRYGPNDIKRVTDDKQRSFVKVSRGKGFSRFQGLMFELVSEHHITADEFRRRGSLPWPTAPGTLIQALEDAPAEPCPAPGASATGRGPGVPVKKVVRRSATPGATDTDPPVTSTNRRHEEPGRDDQEIAAKLMQFFSQVQGDGAAPDGLREGPRRPDKAGGDRGR